VTAAEAVVAVLKALGNQGNSMTTHADSRDLEGWPRRMGAA
jgi:hypothetical protein